MNTWVARPEWGGWIVAYFFLGGIAGGAYFLAVLIEWWGSAEDRPLAQIAYKIAFPLIVICGLLLIIDLFRPERFWHMLVKSEIVEAAFAAGFPSTRAGWRLAISSLSFKYWSPMSLGSWGLAVFGACACTSFVATLWPTRRIGRWLQARWVKLLVQVIGCISGLFIASYTGTLLTATNQPVWSDTWWLASLFLTSAISASVATIALIAALKNVGTPQSRQRLAGIEPFILILELVVLGIVLVSLRDELPAILRSRAGLLLIGVAVAGVAFPLLMHVFMMDRRRWNMPLAALLVLTGGLVLRMAILNLPTGNMHAAPSPVVRISPEDGRKRGDGPGADIHNYTNKLAVRTKLHGQ